MRYTTTQTFGSSMLFSYKNHTTRTLEGTFRSVDQAPLRGHKAKNNTKRKSDAKDLDMHVDQQEQRIHTDCDKQ